MAQQTQSLIVHCQLALGLTQAELGEIVGVHKRTIQRWQDGQPSLLPDQAEKLAAALRPVRPDLAEEVLELGRRFAARTGMAPPTLPATAEEIEEVVRAAAEAGGTSTDAVRPVIRAAFAKAKQLGLEVVEIVGALEIPEPPAPTDD